MTKEERLLRQEQRERAKAIEAAAREAGRGPLDLPYLLLVLTLVGVGLIMLFSASFPSAYYEEGNPAYYLIRQGIFAILGITAMFIVGKINYERYRAVAKMLLIFSIILLVLVLIPGIGTGRLTHGAQRWIRIGSFQFQPSEALKVATVLFLARQLAGRQSKIDKIRIVPSLKFWTWRSSREQRRIWREGTWPILMPVVVSCAVIFPAHTSSAVLVFMASWVGRVRLGELVKLIGLACIGIVFIMTLNLGRSETAEGRVSTWIHLWTRSQTEKPIEHLTDTERSMIAIHNGGVFGEGAGQSAMRVEMIHPESDYAYAFFVEEYGIVLALALLMLYLWIFFRGIEIFRRCGTAFPGLLVLGLALLITCQALLHIMVTVNLIPETGQTLPLISRGGSSVTSSLSA